jgi:hypothetical protein
MADVRAVKTGNWSDTTVWNTSALPTSVDNVYSNGFTVTIDIDPTVFLVSNRVATGITGSGSFTLNSNRILTSNIEAGPNGSCVNFTGTNSTIVGNISGSNTTANDNYSGVNFTGTGVLTISGNVHSGLGTRSSYGIQVGAGTLNVYGSVFGDNAVNGSGIRQETAEGTVYVYGNCISRNDPAITVNASLARLYVFGDIFGSSTGTQACIQFSGGSGVYIVGNVYGGNVGSAFGVQNSSSSTLFLTGNIYGGGSAVGINNAAAGTVSIQGNAIGGSGAAGVNNASTGVATITKVVGNAFGLGSVGIGSVVGASNTQNGRLYVEQVEFGPRGQTPISGPVYIIPSNRNTLTGVLTALGNTVTFYNSLSVDGLLPPTSSVQLGTVYNVGNSVGTMAVPSASAVEFGVPVDNTVGVAALTPQTVWGYSRLSATDVGSMGDRLRNAATAQSVGSQIASFNL